MNSPTNTARANRRRSYLAAGAALGLALVATGCTTGTNAGETPGQGTDTLRSVFTADPNTFAPYALGGVDTTAAAQLMYETLVHRDEDNTFVGGLATEWKMTPTQGVFSIRKDATCGDGTAITPSIVADSLNVFADPKSGSTFTQLAFGKGKATITADDTAGTVTVDLAQPWSDMLNGVSLAATGIVCPAGIKDPKALAAGDLPEATSGPYTLAKKQPGVSYEFALREGYAAWPAFATKPAGEPAKTIKYTVNDNSSATANELLTGTMDLAVMRGKDISRFDGKPGFTTNKIPAASMFLIFNERDGHPFADAAKRKAVAQSVDRNAFNQAASGGLGEPYTSFAMPGVACSNKDESLLIPRDSDAAGAVLKGLKVRIVGSQAFGPNGAGNTYVAETLRALGADVTLRNVDNTTWVTEISQNPDAWDLTVMGAINGAGTMFGAMSSFVGVPAEDGGLNWAGKANPEVEGLLKQAMTQVDETERCQTYQKIQENLIGEAHAVPLSSLAAQVTARDGFAMSTPNSVRAEANLRITK